MKSARELRQERSAILKTAQQMVETAEGENRDFSPEEQTGYDKALADAESLLKRAERLEKNAELGGVEEMTESRQAPAYNKIKLGDNEARAVAHFIRSGDAGGLGNLLGNEDGHSTLDYRWDSQWEQEVLQRAARGEQRAVTDSSMNITTSGDGGALIQTTVVPKIIERLSEVMLAEKLGCIRIPGKGTTVNHPIDNADAQQFGTTSEQADAHTNTYERDAAQVAVKAFTLVKKTRKVELTEELLDDDDTGVLNFVAKKVGDGLGLTHNYLMVTEAAASGTAFKTFASATVIAVNELEPIVFNDTIDPYLQDSNAAKWVLRRSVHGEIISLGSTSIRYYGENPQGNSQRPSLLNHDAYYSQFAGATAASAKSVYFGNWSYMGYRTVPYLRFVRDETSVDGMVILKYSTRIVYGVLQAAAIGYGVHPSA